MKTCLAVDIGGTKIAAAIIQAGKIITRTQIVTPSSTQPDAMTNALTTLLTPFVEQADFVAVASTGIIDNGVLHALNPKNLGGLNEYALQATIASITKIETVVINDAQAAAWAEYKSITPTQSDMAFITVSTGVGAGIVANSQLLVGQHGIAGHAGHTLADPNGPLCGCGRYGCVESIASGTAIGDAGKAIFGEQTTGKDVFDHYLNQHPDAVTIVDRSAKVIANLIADLKMTNDIQIVSLGGSVGLAQGYLELVRNHLATLPAAYQVDIIAAQCGADAGLIGVAAWAESHI